MFHVFERHTLVPQPRQFDGAFFCLKFVSYTFPTHCADIGYSPSQLRADLFIQTPTSLGTAQSNYLLVLSDTHSNGFEHVKTDYRPDHWPRYN